MVRAIGRRVSAVRAVALALGAAVVVGGCVLGPSSLDGPMAVNLHVATTPTSVDVDAPGWFADTSQVFLCPSDPPPLPEPGPARVGWTPGSTCHDFGTHPSPDGLVIRLPVADLAPSDRPAFAAADDWYLLLLEVDREGRVTGATRTRFARPDGFVE
jgi:hypothetical protein